MKAEINYQSKFSFETRIRNHTFMMDTSLAAGGDNKGPSPKELLLASIIGCTGMDVAAYLKKHKMVPSKLDISTEAEPRSEHPRVFTALTIKFDVDGVGITAEAVLKAVHESLTKYCGVSAMVSKVVAISYIVFLQGHQVGEGRAKFDLPI